MSRKDKITHGAKRDIFKVTELSRNVKASLSLKNFECLPAVSTEVTLHFATIARVNLFIHKFHADTSTLVRVLASQPA